MTKYSIMKKSFVAILALLFSSMMMTACDKDLPVDEDGLLITFREECFVSNFELLGTDFQTVRFGAPVIDTLAQTVNVTVLTGTDLKNVYPQFSLATDCKLDPKIVGRVDMSDLASPKEWTVISGNRKIRKKYKVIVKFQ